MSFFAQLSCLSVRMVIQYTVVCFKFRNLQSVFVLNEISELNQKEWRHPNRNAPTAKFYGSNLFQVYREIRKIGLL